MNYLFSVIVPLQTHNQDLEILIKSLENQQFKNFELILVPDHSLNFTSKPKLNFKCINCSDLPSKKRNLAAMNCSGNFLVFIDDDAYPDQSWLQNASIIVQQNKFLCFGGPGLLPDNSTFFEKSTQCYFENKFFNSFSERYSLENPKLVDEWPTMNFFIQKETFLKCGMFDEDFWPGEDSELCLKLRKKNIDIFYDPNLIVFHKPRPNMSKLSRQIFRYGLHRAYLLKSNYRFSDIIFFIPLLNLIILSILITLYSLEKSQLFILYFIITSFILLISFIKLKLKNDIYNIGNYIFSVFLLGVVHFSYSTGLIKGLFTNKIKSKKNR